MASASAFLCCTISSHRATKMRLSIELPQTSSASHLRLLLPLSTWNGLKNRGIPSAHQFLCIPGKKRKCRGRVVYASLFGVGAPEALVIGVVALLVFGPKGLAEVARNLGKTLRSFQPTIRELQEVSREFKSTLEREIGLDEVAAKTNYADKSALKTEVKDQSVIDPNGKPSTGPKTYEELFKITENQLAAKSAEKSSAEGQVQNPDSEKSELETSTDKQVQGLDAESTQQEPPPTVEEAAQFSSESSPTSYPSELASPAQVASETQSSDKGSETEERVTT